jgi:hypothetical protein
MGTARYIIDRTTACPPGWTLQTYSDALREKLAPLGVWLVIRTDDAPGPTGLQGNCNEELQDKVVAALAGLRSQRTTSAVVGTYRR